MENNEIKQIVPRISFDNYAFRIDPINVYMQILKMDGSVLIWIGDNNFNNLNVAIPNSANTNQPLYTKIINSNIIDELSKRLSIALAKMYDKIVYISINMDSNEISDNILYTFLIQKFKDNKINL